MGKVIITGTGRCGTTFLMLIFSELGMDTGYKKSNYKDWIYQGCNSGLEQGTVSNFRFMKNPSFLREMPEMIRDLIIDWVIIPVRNYEDAAESRATYGPGDVPGGFVWGAETKEEQLQIYYKDMAEYVRLMTKHNIPTIWLDFDKMVTDKVYLYTKLKPLLAGINFEAFGKVYDFASEHQKKK